MVPKKPEEMVPKKPDPKESFLYFQDWWNAFPPGCNFDPSDEELVNFYLKRKIAKEALPTNLIKFIPQFDWYSPEDLEEIFERSYVNSDLYYFVNWDYEGNHFDLKVRSGSWKNYSGVVKEIYGEEGKIGTMRTLIFVRDSDPNVHTGWVMQLYTILDEDMMLCKISYSVTNPHTGGQFDQERSRREIAEMIITQEYPLHMVENPALVSFIKNLQPQFHMADFSSVQSDCVDIYKREKENLAKLLGQIPGRMGLAVDLWMSTEAVGYAVLRGHYIDSKWKSHRRILNVVMVPFPYNGDALNHAVGLCLGDWGLVGKVSTITLDKGIWNGSETRTLRDFLPIKNKVILNGQLLVEHCYARFLSSMAQDGLEFIREIVIKVRESIKYVKTSQAHAEKFFELKQQLQVPSTKSLFLDDQTQWNTTYLMLVTAIEVKEVFSCLDSADPKFNLSPSMDEWKQIETLCVYLKLFHDAASVLFLNPTYPTANNYLQEVWKIQMELNQGATSENVWVSNLVRQLKEKSDVYWNECSLGLALAVVMDPQFKMKFVEFSFTQINSAVASKYIRIVEEGVHKLFSDYLIQPLMLTDTIKTKPTEVVSPKPIIPAINDGFSDFDVYMSECSSKQQTKSELDKYLEEALLPRVQKFDVLSWWKLNELKYPILSKMARDILSIPISTVGPDSVFKIEGNKLDHYRSSLRPDTLEALICAKDWLQCPYADPSSSM